MLELAVYQKHLHIKARALKARHQLSEVRVRLRGNTYQQENYEHAEDKVSEDENMRSMGYHVKEAVLMMSS